MEMSGKWLEGEQISRLVDCGWMMRNPGNKRKRTRQCHKINDLANYKLTSKLKELLDFIIGGIEMFGQFPTSFWYRVAFHQTSYDSFHSSWWLVIKEYSVEPNDQFPSSFWYRVVFRQTRYNSFHSSWWIVIKEYSAEPNRHRELHLS